MKTREANGYGQVITVCLLCMKLGICDSPLCKDLISCFSGSCKHNYIMDGVGFGGLFNSYLFVFSFCCCFNKLKIKGNDRSLKEHFTNRFGTANPK